MGIKKYVCQLLVKLLKVVLESMQTKQWGAVSEAE